MVLRAGATLSKEEKKRNSDRESQRTLRERKKARVAYLERTVEQLQKQNSDEKVRELMKEVEALREEKLSLEKLVDQLGTVTSSLKELTTSARGQSSGKDGQSDMGSNTPDTNGTEVAFLLGEFDTIENGLDAGRTHPSRQGQSPTYHEIIPTNFPSAAFSKPPLFLEIGYGFEKLKQRPDAHAILQDTHTIVKATLNGWQSIMQGNDNPLPDILVRLHDRLELGPQSRLIDQLSVYYLTQLSLLRLVDQNHKSYLDMIPAWLLPTPKMRDHIINNPAVTALIRDCESFALAFLRNLRFNPQISIESTFTVDDFNGRLALSRTYRHLFFDDTPFSLAPDFFLRFPEFEHVVPAWRGNGVAIPQTGTNPLVIPSMECHGANPGRPATLDQQRWVDPSPGSPSIFESVDQSSFGLDPKADSLGLGQSYLGKYMNPLSLTYDDETGGLWH
ncbi:hypothetical protein BP5796_07016 [Coleophoma crateriformis]|uniref:BZIP domain-containing protein n=1 Tax=Coleophoma crateriformis TaxID=565419 RepID=A0A3D8RQC0_9HELO|nr:hypothetical protein BP5796_07016 [Coleophoma crateriformis]